MIRQDNLRSYLVKATGGVFILRVTSLALSFALTFLLTRLLSMEDYGIYAWCITWMNVLALFSTFGFDQFVVREVAASISRKEEGFVNVLRSGVSKNVMLFSAVILLIAFVTGYFVIDARQNLIAFIVAVITVPVIALLTVSQSFFRGMKKVFLSTFPDLIIRPVLFLVIIFAVIVTNKNALSPALLLASNLFAFTAAYLFTQISLTKFLPGIPAGNNFKKVRAFSGIYFLALSGAALINNKMDILMLGFLRPELKDVGIYHVAGNLSTLLSFFLLAANTGLAPVISDLYTRQDSARLQKIISKTAQIILLLTVPVFLIFIFFGQFILSLFGPEYQQGYFVLVILSVGQLINVACGSVGYILSMTGNEKLVAVCMWSGALFNIALNLILIPKYGIEGAAIATMAGTIIWNVAMAWLCVRKTGIHSTAAGKIAL